MSYKYLCASGIGAMTLNVDAGLFQLFVGCRGSIYELSAVFCEVEPGFVPSSLSELICKVSNVA